MNNRIKATITRGGEPVNNLSNVTVTIKNLDTDIIEIDNALMNFRGLDAYDYIFTNFNKQYDYHIEINAHDKSLDGKGYQYGGNDLFTDEFINEIAEKVRQEVANDNFDCYRV